MTTFDFITQYFYRIDGAMKDVPKHPQAALYPSEVMTLAFMFAIKGECQSARKRHPEAGQWVP